MYRPRKGDDAGCSDLSLVRTIQRYFRSGTLAQASAAPSADDGSRVRTLAPAAAALAAGALLPLALAPYDIWPAMLVSAGLLFWLLQGLSKRRHAFLIGWLFGVGKYGVGASWVYVSIHVYGGAEPPLAAALVALFVAGLALFTGVVGWFCGGQRGAVAAFQFAFVWTAVEWLLTVALTGFPWLFAGYAFIDAPLAGWAPVGGVLLVSCAAVLTAALLVAAATEKQPLWLLVPASLWLGGWLLQSVPWTQRGEARTVALVQANLDQRTKWTPAGLADALTRHQALSNEAWRQDIVLWSEAAIPDYFHRIADRITAMRPADGGDLVFGAVMAERSPQDDAPVVYNAALSTAGGVYRKRHLVPFGEYVPLEKLLRGTIAFFDLPMSRTSAGEDKQPLLSAAGLDMAMAICYEVAYPATMGADGGGADLLATISNDTWFGASIGPPQHFQIARMRALENGKFLLRATNNGITAIVDERGKVVERLPQFQPGVLTGTAYAMSGTTPFGKMEHTGLWVVSTALSLVISRYAAAWQRRRSPTNRQMAPRH